MAKIFIKDLQINQNIDSVFIVKKLEAKTTKTGSEYLNLVLVDNSGEIEAKYWDGFETFYAGLTENSIVKILAEVKEFNKRLQLNIKKGFIADANEYVLEDLIIHTKKNIEKMFSEMTEVVESFQDSELKQLLQLFIKDQSFIAKFKKAPAGVNMHSACLGGLLEHTVNLINLALYVCSEYQNINRDLLLSGIMLHDIGKVDELDYQRAFRYTTPGKLVGHITMGVLMLNEKIQQIPNFNSDKKIKLEHLLLSHHGVPEFGAVKQPMTLEAVILHQLDNLDAKILGFQEFVEKNPPNDDGWTPRAYMFDNRELYTK